MLVHTIFVPLHYGKKSGQKASSKNRHLKHGINIPYDRREKKQGRIEVVCGSMFSGKTEELIRRLKRAIFAKQKVVIFKPSIDTRYSEADVVSHDHNSISSTPVSSPKSILKLAQNFDVVGIDEAQFSTRALRRSATNWQTKASV